MDPDAATVPGLTNLDSIAHWAGLSGAKDDVRSPRGSLFDLLGVDGSEPPRILALFPATDVSAVLARWQIPDPHPATTSSAPTVAQAGQARLFVRTCRFVCGVETSAASAKAAPTAPPTPAPAAGRRIKMAQVINQRDDQEIEPLDAPAIQRAYRAYADKVGGFPPEDEELSADQLSTLRNLFKSGRTPYTDMAIWGPYQHRLQKKMKMRGMRFAANGEIQPVEMYGPTDYEAWRECYAVFRTGAIMLEEITPARLDAYEKLIRRYSERYGKSCWPIIYQADVRARLEQLERIRRRGQEAADKAAAAASLPCSFDPRKPWEWVFDEIIRDVNFWNREVTEPCMLYLIAEDAPIEKSGTASSSTAAPPRRNQDEADRPPKGQRRPDIREHKLGDDGLFSHNRRGVELCRLFQTGECMEKDARGNCKRNPHRRHQCAKCLSDSHGANKCNADAPKPPRQFHRKGKGKGNKGYTCKEFDIENGQQFDLTSDIVWANVMSDIRTGKYVSMYKLDEFEALLKQPAVEFQDIVQCQYGATTTKPTTLMLNNIVGWKWRHECEHPKQIWIKPSTGERVRSSHPPLKGKEWFILAEDWDKSLLMSPQQIRARDKQLPYLTKAAQAYPANLNKEFAEVIIASWNKASESRQGQTAPAEMIKVHMILNKFLDDRPEVEQSCLQAIGSDRPDAGPDSWQLSELRDTLMMSLDTGQQFVLKPGLDTKLDAGLIWTMARAFGDPDADTVYTWLTEGAPAGIDKPIEDPGEVFPPYDLDGTEPLTASLPEPTTHRNYTSVDNDEAAGPEVNRLISTGFVRAFDSLPEFRTWLGGDPHLSKLGMITKVRDGKVKRRLILDCKESGVNGRAKKSHRLILPRATDVVEDALKLLENCKDEPEATIEWLILDFTDWFFNVPLHPTERKHFTLSHGGRYVAYVTQAQGSVNAPLICGRVAALLARMTQGIFGVLRYRLQLYVDDPIITVAGTATQRNRAMAATIVLWAVLGVRLAYRKAARGSAVTWIGAELSLHDLETKDPKVRVKAKPDIVREVADMTEEHARTNVTSYKSMLTCVGKLNHIAGLVEVVRPFMTDLYGVIHAKGPSRAPPGCLWNKQWRPVTLWLLAFFANEAYSIQRFQRIYRLQAYLGQGLDLRIITDASPWGIGGVLTINGACVAYFTSAMTKADESLLHLQIGSPDGQQIAEALAMLVALRLWRHYWRQCGINLQMRSDSVTGLTLLMKLRTRVGSHGLNLIAREVALEFGNSAYKPRMFQHIPGIANDIADCLSRIHQPGKHYEVPAILQRCRQEQCQERDRSYYMTLVAAQQRATIGHPDHDTVSQTGNDP
ncbi:unnamed protein product [Durusdinium trenchii]|uniref:Reverse transcriptase domain-containing protein n=1 Tax=Durusdinium trenchii TaxID=1381693 RepID=A0ABP0JKJ0_9DINO